LTNALSIKQPKNNNDTCYFCEVLVATVVLMVDLALDECAIKEYLYWFTGQCPWTCYAFECGEITTGIFLAFEYYLVTGSTSAIETLCYDVDSNCAKK